MATITKLKHVPDCLKKLARVLARGYYGATEVRIVDLLIKKPVIKESAIVADLQVGVLEIRSCLWKLQADQMVESRSYSEIGGNERFIEVFYYCVNFHTVVTAAKQEVNRIRRHFELELIDEPEVINKKKTIFRCSTCAETFSDLDSYKEADCDSQETMLACPVCKCVMEKAEGEVVPKKNKSYDVANFKQSYKDIYSLLCEVENVKLAPKLIVPVVLHTNHLEEVAHMLASKFQKGKAKKDQSTSTDKVVVENKKQGGSTNKKSKNKTKNLKENKNNKSKLQKPSAQTSEDTSKDLGGQINSKFKAGETIPEAKASNEVPKTESEDRASNAPGYIEIDVPIESIQKADMIKYCPVAIPSVYANDKLYLLNQINAAHITLMSMQEKRDYIEAFVAYFHGRNNHFERNNE